jgi:hypothetical protein
VKVKLPGSLRKAESGIDPEQANRVKDAVRLAQAGGYRGARPLQFKIFEL